MAFESKLFLWYGVRHKRIKPTYVASSQSKLALLTTSFVEVRI